MIDSNDLAAIDAEYFDIKEIKEYTIVLQSKSTGHYWHLLEQEYNNKRSFLIHHKHSIAKPYHPQKNKPSISACCEYIKDHDAYHMERSKKKEHKQKRFRSM